MHEEDPLGDTQNLFSRWFFEGQRFMSKPIARIILGVSEAKVYKSNDCVDVVSRLVQPSSSTEQISKCFDIDSIWSWTPVLRFLSSCVWWEHVSSNRGFLNKQTRSPWAGFLTMLLVSSGFFCLHCQPLDYTFRPLGFAWVSVNASCHRPSCSKLCMPRLLCPC